MDSNYEITLSFDYFNLSRSSDCSDDYVEVRDGQFDTSELVGKFCGADIPESITSDSWDMRLTFKSSGKTKYPGFKASYKTKSKFVMVKVTLLNKKEEARKPSNLPDGCVQEWDKILNCLPAARLRVHENSLKRVRAFQIELEFGSVLYLRRGENWSTRRKTSRSYERTNNKLNPHMASTPGFEPGPHW